MVDRKTLSLRACKNALSFRSRIGLDDNVPLCIFDVIEEKVKIRLLFVEIPSLEGTYIKKSAPEIQVSSLRPPPRQAYNAAHELGHHIFGHGSRVDEVKGENGSTCISSSQEEFLADAFAGYFLMPRRLVANAFRERGIAQCSCNAEQIFAMACWLGVGYETLITHAHRSLNLITEEHAKTLSKDGPKKIRARILGKEIPTNLVIVDANWRNKAIDVQVGDLILLSHLTDFKTEGECVRLEDSSPSGALLIGSRPGIGRVIDKRGQWASYVRVSRKNYHGWSAYRHLEDPDHE